MYDLIVIGAGSGGVRTARMAAQAGKKVAIVEYQALGGTCVNVGCVPKKLLVYAAQFSDKIADAKGFGWDIPQANFSWRKLIENKNKEIRRLNDIYEQILLDAGVTIIKGFARFIDKNTLAVSAHCFSAKNIVIATGSKAFVPEITGKQYLSTSSDMFYLETLPKKILIVGGGFIALEFAGIMNALGVETVISYRGEQILRGFDNGVRDFLAQEISKKGVRVYLHSHLESIRKVDEQLEVHFKNGSKERFDKVLCAMGRKANIENLDLDKVGLTLSAEGAVVVNEQFQSSVENIYALGDVIDRIQLTPVALAEAMTLVKIFGGETQAKMDYSSIPSAVFSQPSVACVGLTEEQAREKNIDIEIYETDFSPMKYALGENEECVFMKLVVDKKSNKVLGAHMVGDDAAEIIQGIAIAIKAGASKKDFDSTLGIHPSAAEEFVTMRTMRTMRTVQAP